MLQTAAHRQATRMQLSMRYNTTQQHLIQQILNMMKTKVKNGKQLSNSLANPVETNR